MDALADPQAAAPGAVVDAFFDAISRADIPAARACCTPDAIFWHSFDGVPMDLDTISRDWAALAEAFPERAFVDARRSPTPDGFVQQHMMTARSASGERMAWAICMVIRLREGRISRLDEYIDRAGLAIDWDHPVTPGLPPREERAS
jgi:ketosteroid isomerase-like protein